MRTWGRSERPSPLSAFGHCQVSLGLRSSINGSTKDQNSVALFVMINVGPISTWTAENHEHNAEYTVLFLITGVCCFLRLRSPWWWERFSVDQPSTRKPCLPVPVCLSLCVPVCVSPTGRAWGRYGFMVGSCLSNCAALLILQECCTSGLSLRSINLFISCHGVRQMSPAGPQIDL